VVKNQKMPSLYRSFSTQKKPWIWAEPRIVALATVLGPAKCITLCARFAAVVDEFFAALGYEV